MTQFRLIKRTRQLTEYSCGASALQSVASHWGREIEEDALMKLLGTNAEVGTFPEDMVRGARALGLDVRWKENASLDEIASHTSRGDPVIALAQLWRSEKDTPASAADEWDCGHYIVVLSVDREHVYFQDPYISMGKGFVPRAMFEEHWHQIMGGAALARSPKLVHVAIFVSGEERGRRTDEASVTAPKIDFGAMATINVVNVEFRRHLLPFDFLDELRGFEEGSTRAAAFVLLRKDEEGRISGMQGGRVRDSSDAIRLNALIAALAVKSSGGNDSVLAGALSGARAAAAGDFGLAAADLKRRATMLSPGTSEIILIFEDVWDLRLDEAVRKHDGVVARRRLVGRSELDELGREISKG